MIERKDLDGLTRWLRGLVRAEQPDASASARARDAGNDHLARASDSLRALLSDRSIPPAVRDALRADYAEIEALLDKLEQQQLHVAAFGRVSVGKSALLNALAGAAVFDTGVLHGTTT